MLRALWRLARVGLHVLHGLAVVRFELPRAGEAERLRRIGWWSRRLLQLFGIVLEVDGTPQPGGRLLVANHVSWLDIVAVHAVCPEARFVSKADVLRWPLLARLIGAGGTLYIARERKRDARQAVIDMAAALRAGSTIAIFPEGTTTGGVGVLPFHANLLQAAVVAAVRVQPLALLYADARHGVSPAPAYVGDTSLLESVWRVARADGLRARLLWLPALPSGADRRALGRALHASIDAALRSRSAGSVQPLP